MSSRAAKKREVGVPSPKAVKAKAARVKARKVRSARPTPTVPRALRRASWREYVKAQRKQMREAGGCVSSVRIGRVPFNQSERNPAFGQWVCVGPKSNRAVRRSDEARFVATSKTFAALCKQEERWVALTEGKAAGRAERQGLRFIRYLLRALTKAA